MDHFVVLPEPRVYSVIPFNVDRGKLYFNEHKSKWAWVMAQIPGAARRREHKISRLGQVRSRPPYPHRLRHSFLGTRLRGYNFAFLGKKQPRESSILNFLGA